MLDTEVGPAKLSRGSLARWYILLGLLVPWTVLTFLAVNAGSPNDVQHRNVFLTTLTAISGPFVGAIARGSQGCCLKASIDIAKFAGPPLALGIAVQFVAIKPKVVPLALWTVGWLGWFLGGFVSFLHALN